MSPWPMIQAPWRWNLLEVTQFVDLTNAWTLPTVTATVMTQPPVLLLQTHISCCQAATDHLQAFGMTSLLLKCRLR